MIPIPKYIGDVLFLQIPTAVEVPGIEFGLKAVEAEAAADGTSAL
jgi:hypothetical protein